MAEYNPRQALVYGEVRPSLARRGFFHDPCAYLNAGPNEQKDVFKAIDALFVDYPELDVITNPGQSSVLLASNGDGKTTTLWLLRKKFSKLCSELSGNRQGQPLVVVYDSFEQLSGLSGSITLEDHLPPFLQAVASEIWRFITDCNEYPPRLNDLTPQEQKQAKTWLWAFLHHHLPIDLEFEPLLAGNDKLRKDWKKARSSNDPLSRPGTFPGVMDVLKQKIKCFGFDSMIILVEVDTAKQNPAIDSVAAFIKPLLNAIASFSHVTFKFFLPDTLENVVQQSRGYIERPLKVISLTWNHEMLIAVLRNRFRWASNDFETVDQLFHGELLGKHSVEDELVSLALKFPFGKPRALITLLNELLNRLDENGFLTLDDWQACSQEARRRLDVLSRSAVNELTCEQMLKEAQDRLEKLAARTTQIRFVISWIIVLIILTVIVSFLYCVIEAAMAATFLAYWKVGKWLFIAITVLIYIWAIDNSGSRREHIKNWAPFRKVQKLRENIWSVVVEVFFGGVIGNAVYDWLKSLSN